MLLEIVWSIIALLGLGKVWMSRTKPGAKA
jgi:hypothetical protein